MTDILCARRFLIAALAVVFLSGCGGTPRGAVSGTVTWQGKPVEQGSISFISSGKENIAASSPIANGQYSIPAATGPAVGPNRVEILGYKKIGQREAGRPSPPGTMVDELEEVVPKEFNHASKLTAEVKGGSTTLDFALPK